MIWALATVGVLGLAVGAASGLAMGGILAADKLGRAVVARNRAVYERDRAAADLVAMTASRNWWRTKAIRAGRWLPQEVVADVIAEEVQAS